MATFLLRSKRQGDHIREQIFVGPDRDHLVLAGELVLNVGEWQEFGAALKLGAERTHQRIIVILEGGDAIVGA